jgi:thymidylate kinase
LSRRGALFALSGVDCAGKSTQRELLMDALRSRGYTPVTLWTRAGYTPGLKAIKRALRALTGVRKPRRQGVSEEPGRYPRRLANLGHPLKRWLWLTAALLDLLWVYGVRIRIWKARGRIVVCDRYLLDCRVDFRVNFPADRIEDRLLFRLLRCFSVRPDAAFCLLVPAEMSLERGRGKSRFHWEPLEVLRQRRTNYEALSNLLGVQVLDGERPAGEIARSIQRSVAGTLPASNSPAANRTSRTQSSRGWIRSE